MTWDETKSYDPYGPYDPGGGCISVCVATLPLLQSEISQALLKLRGHRGHRGYSRNQAACPTDRFKATSFIAGEAGCHPLTRHP